MGYIYIGKATGNNYMGIWCIYWDLYRYRSLWFMSFGTFVSSISSPNNHRQVTDIFQRGCKPAEPDSDISLEDIGDLQEIDWEALQPYWVQVVFGMTQTCPCRVCKITIVTGIDQWRPLVVLGFVLIAACMPTTYWCSCGPDMIHWYTCITSYNPL